jgi:hypothetical protein
VGSKFPTTAVPENVPGEAGLIWRWRHLVGRFFGVLWARVDLRSHGVLNRYLSPPEKALFLTMSVPDQRHSLDLCARLQSTGHDQPDLLRAALLHDVGKGTGSLPLVHRVIYSLAAVTWPALARWLGQSASPIWRRPFYLAAHHPRLGAKAAEQAGSNATVVRLIGGHNAPGEDDLSQILYNYDRRM